MPTSALRQARNARRWSQTQLINAIEEYANRRGLVIATTASLRVYVSEWENGRRAISDEYAAILRAVLGLTDDELRGDESEAPPLPLSDGYDELLAQIDSSSALGSSMVDTFLGQTELLRTMDRQMGAAQLVDQMSAHLRAMQDALTFAVLPASRRPLGVALAGAATLGAWQALSVGAADRAWRHYELGKIAARDAEAPAYLAHAMGEQAYVLADAGRPETAVELVREAQRVGGTQISGRLVSWLAAAEAELSALAGHEDDCRRALDKAEASLPADDDARAPDVASIFLDIGHLTRWRGNALALLGDGQAVSDLYVALDSMDPTFARAAAGLRCDLAQAHLVRGEYDEATSHLRAARLIANRTGAVRHRRRIERLTKSVPR